MSSTSVTYLVAACAGVFSLAAFGVWVLAPAWSAYTRAWERVAAIFLSFYVLLAFVGMGIGVGAVVIYYWDQLFPNG